MRVRLSILMFMQYAAPGALLPLYTLLLKELGFSEMQIAWCCATQAMAIILVSLFVGQVADRWLPAQYCLAGCAFLGGLDLWLLAELTQPWAMFLATLVFSLLLGASTLLTTTICFTHLPQPEKNYGPIRLWGTVGWMISGWVLGYWLTDPEWSVPLLTLVRPTLLRSHLSDAPRLGGLLAWCLAVYALTLPHTPPRKDRGGGLVAPLAALRFLSSRALFIFCACAFGVWMTLPMTMQNTPLLLEHLEFSSSTISVALTLGQGMEVLALALLPFSLRRLGIRSTMLVGLGAWTLGLTLQAIGQPTPLVVCALGCHGLMIAGFVITGQVFLNQQTRGDLRASTQSLIHFVNATGMLVGHLFAGQLRVWTDGNFSWIFGVGACIMACLFILFLVGFRARPVTLAESTSGSRLPGKNSAEEALQEKDLSLRLTGGSVRKSGDVMPRSSRADFPVQK